MIAGRLASILLFVLTLGFLVCAAPSGAMDTADKAVAQRRDTGSLAPLTTLEGMTRKQLDSCMRVKSVEEAKPIIETLITNIKTTTESLSQSGKVEVNDSAKTDIAVRIASIITLIAKIVCSLIQKIGVDAVRSLCGELDVSLKALLSVCVASVGDILPTVAAKIADVKTEAFLKNDLVECAKLLGFAA